MAGGGSLPAGRETVKEVFSCSKEVYPVLSVKSKASIHTQFVRRTERVSVVEVQEGKDEKAKMILRALFLRIRDGVFRMISLLIFLSALRYFPLLRSIGLPTVLRFHYSRSIV